jgi:hypothetical protein
MRAPSTLNSSARMDTIVLLITFSAGALAIHHKDRLRHLLPRRDATGSVVTDRTLGLARLTLPEGWRQAQDLNESAGIEAIHPPLGRHVIVISDAIEDFSPEVTMIEHSANTRRELTNSIQVIGCSGPERRQVAGFESVQYEIEGYYHQTRVKYLHTTVAGKRAFHQVLAWSTISRYDRAAFDALLSGFDEMPDAGSDRAAVVASGPIQIEPVSKYLVH